MDIITSTVVAVHIIASVLIIITVLLQPGKSGDLGSIFGGSTQSVFGATGAVPFLTKVTRVLALIFLITSLSLGYISTQKFKSSVIRQGAETTLPSEAGEKALSGEAEGAANVEGESLQPGQPSEGKPAGGVSTESGSHNPPPGKGVESMSPAQEGSGTR